jgi:hypothetical protein
MLKVLWALILIPSLIVIVCLILAKQSSDRASRPTEEIRRDSWWAPGGGAGAPGQWSELDAKSVFEVLPSKKEQAIQELQTEAAAPVSKQRFTELVGKPLPTNANGSPYLVRALRFYRLGGGYSIRWNQGQLVVHYSCLGHSVPAEIRDTLILLLPAKPTQVFVDATMAE